MRLFLIVADDPFYVPVFLKEFLGRFRGDVIGAAIIPPHSPPKPLRRYILDHYYMYGLYNFMMLVLRYIWRRYLLPFFDLVKGQVPRTARLLLSDYGCSICYPRNVNDARFVRYLKSLGLDLIVSVASSQIFRRAILGVPRVGCLNIHGSLLPKHRGINPSFWVLLEGEKETGITVHLMDEHIDTGPIVLQRPLTVSENETLDSLSYRIARVGARVTEEAIGLIETAEDLEPRLDSKHSESYHSFPTKNDGRSFRKKGLRFF
jgi:methionyl-tRNA formyltransferase